ncbi:MAG: hypothetical protein C4527_07330 [Candidatus Omnitrophota bacterium]|nr:MAG: hypothetical protein C4527_07330 [Candidatus Omnitrophota bacterium]
MINVKDLTYATFAPHVNTLFRITRNDRSVIDLELVEVIDQSGQHNHRSGTPQMETFSLLFRGPLGEYISQETYPFSHPELGSFRIFITPVVGKDSKGFYYQALFNRLVSDSGDHSADKEIL